MKESHRKCPVLLDFRHFETFRNLRKSRTILGPIGHKKVTNLSGFFRSRFSDLPGCGGRILCSLHPGMNVPAFAFGHFLGRHIFRINGKMCVWHRVACVLGSRPDRWTPGIHTGCFDRHVWSRGAGIRIHSYDAGLPGKSMNG